MVLCAYQPYVFPQLHYFNRIVHADVFVVMDDVQFSPLFKRTVLKTSNGVVRFSVPVSGKVCRTKIKRVMITTDDRLVKKLLATIKDVYGRTPFFEQYFDMVVDFFKYPMFANACTVFIRKVLTKLLKWHGVILLESELLVCKADDRGGNQHILDIALQLKADTYICGETAVFGKNAYLQPETFAANGIKLLVQKWNTPEYPQRYGNVCSFRQNLSIIDALFNVGEEKTIEILTEGEYCYEYTSS